MGSLVLARYGGGGGGGEPWRRGSVVECEEQGFCSDDEGVVFVVVVGDLIEASMSALAVLGSDDEGDGLLRVVEGQGFGGDEVDGLR